MLVHLIGLELFWRHSHDDDDDDDDRSIFVCASIMITVTGCYAPDLHATYGTK